MGSILKHNKILSATIILTAAGIIARCLGFVNRIFLSQLIGAKELGIYQMITPVSMLIYSLTTHGITTSLTKLTAKLFAKENFLDSKKLLKKATILTLFLSFVAFVIVYFKADFICTNILGASMLTDCLKLLSFSFFPIAIKGCILAYFLGMENSKIHAVSQLMEQCFRVGCIFFFAYYIPSISHNVLLAVYGLVVGEYTSFLFTYFYYVKNRKKINLLFFKKNNIDNNKNSEKILDKISHNDSNKIHTKEPDLKKISHAKENSYGFRALISQSIPITTNRFIITLFTSIEAVIIPKMLLLYFHDYQTAMVEYGCLTGMALPFLLFPATITNSLALILAGALLAYFIFLTLFVNLISYPLLEKVLTAYL